MFTRSPLQADPLRKEAWRGNAGTAGQTRAQAFWVMHSAYLFLEARLHRSMTVHFPQ